MCGLRQEMKLEQRLSQQQMPQSFNWEPKDNRPGKRFCRVDVAAFFSQPKEVTRPHEAQNLTASIWQMPAEPHHAVIDQVEEVGVFTFGIDCDTAGRIGENCRDFCQLGLIFG